MQMSPDAIREASDLLAGHWLAQTRLDALPEAIRPATREEGYAIQALIEEHSAAPLFGWKIAATSPAGQAHIAVDGPLAGRILAERVIPQGGTCPFANNLMKAAELEFAFRMGETLAPREAEYEMEEVLDAVATMHPAIEIPDSRYEVFTRVGAPQLIADNACAHYFMLGEATSENWRDADLAGQQVTGFVGDGPAQPGVGSNVLGDPRVALLWLVNELSANGITLKAGEVVTTGTCVPPMTISPGDLIRGEFGPYGAVSLTMGD
jgi:2-keto-4-pentenoate hydratase